MKNITIVFILVVSGNYLYCSNVSGYYLFQFHTELPLHYRAEMCLLDNKYKKLIQNFELTEDNEYNEIFEQMEHVVSRLSLYRIAKYDYEEEIKKHKNKLSELKRLKGH